MLYWLSFCDPDQPKGRQFSGVALVEADDEYAAVSRAWLTGCNPGGEIALVEIPVDNLPPEREAALLKAPRDTLMTEAALEEAGLLP